MGLSLTRQGMDAISVSAVNPVQSVTGEVSNGNLKIAVNGVESGDIPLPENTPVINFNSAQISTSNVIDVRMGSDTPVYAETVSELYISSNTYPIKTLNNLRITSISSVTSTYYYGTINTNISMDGIEFTKMPDGDYLIQYLGSSEAKYFFGEINASKSGRHLSIDTSARVVCTRSPSSTVMLKIIGMFATNIT